jgi:hypothetical protein
VPCYLGTAIAEVVEIRRAYACDRYPHQLAVALRVADFDYLHAGWRIPYCPHDFLSSERFAPKCK